MERRGFLKSILALGAAPAIVRAESLMKLYVPSQELYRPVALDSAGKFPMSQYYNAQLVRQDEFGEAFFPTITIQAENGLLIAWDDIIVKPIPFPPTPHPHYLRDTVP